MSLNLDCVTGFVFFCCWLRFCLAKEAGGGFVLALPAMPRSESQGALQTPVADANATATVVAQEEQEDSLSPDAAWKRLDSVRPPSLVPC